MQKIPVKTMRYFFIVLIIFKSSCVLAQGSVKVINVGKAWADNSVNATVFRKNSMVTFMNTQFIAFYDDSAEAITDAAEASLNELGISGASKSQ